MGDPSPDPRVLVLSGGGNRALYSFHLLRTLHRTCPAGYDNNIKLIVGTSAGAIVGAIVALGMLETFSPQDLHELTAQVFSDDNAMGPLLGPMYRGDAKRRALRKLFGSKTMGQLPQKPALCIVTATAGGRLRLIRSYDPADANIKLCNALDATSAVPIMFPPVKLRTETLIDGGVLANNPVKVALLESISFFSSGDKQQETKTADRTCHTGPRPVFVSIGAPAAKQEPDTTRVDDMGIGRWLAIGLFSVLLGVHDETDARLVRHLVGDARYFEFRSAVTSRTDDTSKEYHDALENAALTFWHAHKGELHKAVGCESE